MQLSLIKKYLKSSVDTPFFLFVSDGQYATVKDHLSALGLTMVRMSDFCGEDDKWPDMDDLEEHLKSAYKNHNGKNIAVLGLGEYLAARGIDETKKQLYRLKCLKLGDAKVLLLLHGPGLSKHIAALKTDIRFDERCHYVIEEAASCLSFTLADPSVGLPALKGIKALLRKYENGDWGNDVLKSVLGFDKASFGNKLLSSNYHGIRHYCPGLLLPSSCGSDEQWAELLQELKQNDYSLDAVLEKHDLKRNLEINFYPRITADNYHSWLYFIALKNEAATLTNSYLRFVAEGMSTYKDFKKNVLNVIIDIPHTDKRFAAFYRDRKALLEKFPEPEIAEFVYDNRVNESESIYKLTDWTLTEREEIIAWVSRNGLIPEIVDIYPALADYRKVYTFKCPGREGFAEMLTSYFEKYKEQKIDNALDPEFLKQVDSLARPPREFNQLPTRNEVLEGFDISESFLLWLDALGVEYLAYIVKMAQERELSISINIARAELPTITSPFNNDFFEVWPEDRRRKIQDLDDVKHCDAGGYNFTNNELPIHLARELEIIKTVINEAATKLAGHKYKRVLIVSDHGASRLAVLARKEERYETDTKSKYSGRCCEYFEPYDLPFASVANGYLVLADYGRFRGSRAANVEVHGGASLEEVIVPVIELALKDGRITVRLAEEEVSLDFRAGTAIELFFNSPVKDVSVLMKDKRYRASEIGENRYRALLTDIKKAGDYSVEIYAMENLIGQVTLRAKGKSGKVKSDFDDQF